MLTAGGTGVASYARVLVEAAQMGGHDVRILTATPGRRGLAGSLVRWIRAWRRMAILEDDGVKGLVGRDVFRRAQVRFNLHGRILELCAPGPPGIMHWTYPVPMAMRGWINLYTIHDAIPLLYPGLTPIDGDRHRRLLSALRPYAERIVTVSEPARQDVVRALGWPSDFVVNLGLAVKADTSHVASLPAGLSSKGYLLFCGQIEPRKNLTRLIQAYAESGITMPLVLVGPDGWRAKPIVRQARAVAGVVRFPYLDRATLLKMIADARALVLPSLAEGFGLPVAEAMAHGTPVLTSQDPALVSVAGGAALTVDGEDIDALRKALILLATDDPLCADLSARGRARAHSFGLRPFATRMGGFYASLVAQPG